VPADHPSAREAVRQINPFVAKLDVAAAQVKKWSTLDVGEGTSLRDALTIEGVPFWDAISVDLALYRVPRVPNSRRGSRLKQLVRPVLAPLRYRSALGISGRVPAHPSASPGGALVLGFSEYMTRDVLIPVAEAMASTDLRPTVVLVPPGSSPASTGSVLVQSWGMYWDPNVKARARHLRAKLSNALSLLRKNPRLSEIFSSPARHSGPVADAITNQFSEYGKFILAPHAAIAENVLRLLRPSVLVSADVADPRNRIYTLLARKHGIPSLEIQFGAFGEEATEWRFFNSMAVAVWGYHSRQVLAEHGVPLERIHVTGSPRHDRLRPMSDDDRRRVRERFGAQTNEKLVVLISVYSLDAYQTKGEREVLVGMKRDAITAAVSSPGIRLVVKPHPLEDVRETASLAAGAGNVVVSGIGEDISTLVGACDALVTFGSTATLDALILDKPTISLAYPGWEWGELFVNTGATEVCTTANQIRSALREIASDSGIMILARHAKNREAMLREWVGAAPGTASQSIAKLATDLAAQSTRRSERG
jgi:hypothetical protein